MRAPDYTPGFLWDPCCSSFQFSVCGVSSFCVLCSKCCQCLWIDHSRFSLMFIRFVFTPICFVRNSYFINVTCIYLLILMSSTIPCRMMFVSFKNNTTSVTSGGGIASPSGAPVFTLGFYWGSCCSQSLVFCVVFCRSLFVLFLLAIVLSVLRFTASDCCFGIFKPFMNTHYPTLNTIRIINGKPKQIDEYVKI